MSDIERQTSEFTANFLKMRNEIGKVIVGNEPIIDGVLICLLANGHALLACRVEVDVDVALRVYHNRAVAIADEIRLACKACE